MDIDGAVDINRQNRTFLAPNVFNVANNTKSLKYAPIYILRGKIPKNAKKCTISLLTVKNANENITTKNLFSESDFWIKFVLFNSESSVESPMNMFMDFEKNEIVINTIVKKV